MFGEKNPNRFGAKNLSMSRFFLSRKILIWLFSFDGFIVTSPKSLIEVKVVGDTMKLNSELQRKKEIETDGNEKMVCHFNERKSTLTEKGREWEGDKRK